MESVHVRLATVADAPVLAHHRSAMFQDMGLLPEGVAEQLRDASIGFFREALAGGKWFAWIAEVGDAVAGGAVLHLDGMPPRNGPGGVFIPSQPQGLIMNVYVEPDHRRSGIASLLMAAVLDFARAKGAASVTLHASPKGRLLYEKLGFTPTHEMRLFL
ncbi:MAG: GNAT family N-acetyltransferase [Fimbriimonadaceae bacterium]